VQEQVLKNNFFTRRASVDFGASPAKSGAQSMGDSMIKFFALIALVAPLFAHAQYNGGLFGPEITPGDFSAAGGDINRAQELANGRAAQQSGTYPGYNPGPSYTPAPVAPLSPEQQQENWLYGAPITGDDYRAAGGDMDRAQQIANDRAATLSGHPGEQQNPYNGQWEPKH